MIDRLQAELYEWQQEEYPQSTVWTDIAGVAEEFGELAATQIDILSGRQPEKFNSTDEALKDAIGDLLIYTGQFASKHDLTLAECYKHAAEEVMDDDSRHG